MQKTKLMLSRLKNDRLMLALTSALFILTLGYIIIKSMLCYLSSSSPLSYLSATLDMSMIVFVFFMFLSYEYLCRIKQEYIEEVLKATGNGQRSFYVTGIWVLILLLTIYVLTVLCINLVIYFCLNIEKTEYLIHIVLNVFLNIFLIPLVGILLGASVSFVKKRIAAYILMLVTVFISTPMFTTITDAVYESTGKSMALIRGIFDIFPPSLGYSQIYSFGYSVLPYRWSIGCFWMFFLMAVLTVCLASSKKIKSTIVTFICIAVAALSITEYFMPASKPVLRRNVDSSGISDMDYYSSATQKNNAAKFKIEKYDLSLRIERQLSCEATLFLDTDNLPTYEFTLYHGFKVESIRSNTGKNLQFEQTGDYFSINRADEPLKSVIVKYSGSAPRFFSNSQGTSLPGWFAYYPHAGERELYDYSMFGFGFNRILCQEDTKFEISVDCKNKVFCNLDEKDGKYIGETDGVTIVSGFYDSFMCENIQVIYPYLDTVEFSAKNMTEKVCTYLNNGIIDKNSKKIMVVANLNMASVYERFCRLSDHTVISQLNGLSDFYEMQKVPSYKLSLRNAFDYYLSDKQNWNQLIFSLKNEFYAGDEEMMKSDARIMLQESFDELGEDYVERKVSEYLNNNDDYRNWMSFLENLRGEKND